MSKRYELRICRIDYEYSLERYLRESIKDDERVVNFNRIAIWPDPDSMGDIESYEILVEIND